MQKVGDAAGHGRGLVGQDRHGWVTVAEQAVYELIDSGLAVPHVEVEARLFDTGWRHPSAPKPIAFFPHILDEARNNLLSGGNIEIVQRVTKGSAAVELYVPANQRKRTTAVDIATRRKSMLYARFVRASRTFGAAGETVLRRSLNRSALATGYLPMEQGFGEVRRIGKFVTAGPLDSGAWLTLKGPDGLPQSQHALVIEMKNRRLTLYPRHKEVHQLLDKAAQLQKKHPDLPIVPLLVCRRAHDRLFWMAKDLGFLVHASRRHFLNLDKGTTEQTISALQNELGLADLTADSDETANHIIGLFDSTVPKQARATAIRWATVGSQLGAHFANLRDEKITEAERSTHLTALRTDAGVLLQNAGIDDPILAWALEEDDEGDYPDPEDWR
jgi:hypothetical protein